MVWYDAIYNIKDGELKRAQSFEESQKYVRLKIRPKNDFIKKVSAAALQLIFFNVFRAVPWYFMFIKFTNWILIFTMMATVLEVYLCSTPRLTFSVAPNMHVCHHIFYTLALFTNPIVVIIYWGLEHPHTEGRMNEMYGDDPEQLAITLKHMYIVHIVPQVCCLILMVTSNTVMIRRHAKFLVYFALTYAFVNFAATKISGKPLYGLLTWEDYKTPLIVFALISFFVSLFYLTILIDEKITRRSAEKP